MVVWTFSPNVWHPKFISVLICGIVAVVVGQEVNVGEIFMDASYHLDFSSSFYNDLSYYFANVDPEGEALPDFQHPVLVKNIMVLYLQSPSDICLP